MDSPDFLTPLMGLIGVAVSSVGTLLVKHFLDRRRSTAEDSDEDIRFAISEINEIHQRALDLIATTAVDRFLILKAENGKQQPRFATAIYEQHRDRPLFVATLVYHKVRVDESYREMLRKAEAEDVYRMETASMPDSTLKSIYESEGVTHSHCHFLARYPLKSDPSRWVVLFCTFATKSGQDFGGQDRLKIGLFVDWLKDLFADEMDKTR